MKKALFLTAVLLLAISASVFANRENIDGVVATYEAVVVEAEDLAAMPLIATEDFAALQEKAEAAGNALAEIENEREWGIADAILLADLNARFNAAMSAIAKILVQY